MFSETTGNVLSERVHRRLPRRGNLSQGLCPVTKGSGLAGSFLVRNQSLDKDRLRAELTFILYIYSLCL